MWQNLRSNVRDGKDKTQKLERKNLIGNFLNKVRAKGRKNIFFLKK